MNNYTFTIITVCYNAEDQIEKTIESVLNQEFSNYEYIIKDGESTDNTLKIADEFAQKDNHIRIISNKDSGIYDAMNQAIDQANGKYVYFLNAGDCFYDNRVLKNVDAYTKKMKNNILYGDIILQTPTSQIIREYKKICSNKYFYLSGDCICHQAMFARRELFIEKKFDLDYKVCADKEWQLYFLSNKKEKFGKIPLIISNFLTEGYSKENITVLESETLTCLKKYFSGTVWIYQIVYKLKKNDIMVKVLRTIEKEFFIRRQ